MKYQVDHDLHIHSSLSACSNDPLQSPQRILQYARENGLHTVCLTDHFWDEGVEGASNWYVPQDFSHISQARPLPQEEGIRFLFGCETELNSHLTVGISRERMEEFDFIIIPTTHFHMKGYTLHLEQIQSPQTRADAWVQRLEHVLGQNLPFEKIGLAHLTCGLIAPTREEYLAVLQLLPEAEMRRLFDKAAQLGVGIELNSSDMKYGDEEADTVLRPYRIAKDCGCKFYLGSDAHHPKSLDAAPAIFRRAVEHLDLQEDQKFHI